MCEPTADGAPTAIPNDARQARPFIGILFECCRVYARIYRRHDQTEYVGRCPRCTAEVRLRVGPGGSSQRIFRAG